MIDYDADPLNEVPEADRVEQEQSAFRDDDPDDPAFADAADYTEAIAVDADNANPADVIDQAIVVPLDEGADAEER